MKPRSPQLTIDLLLRESKILSMTLYVVAVLSVLFGIVMLGFGVWRNQPILALAGAVETYLFIPAWHFVQALRRENRRIRLIEIGLNGARAASGAVDTLRNPFKEGTQSTAGEISNQSDGQRALNIGHFSIIFRGRPGDENVASEPLQSRGRYLR